MYHKIMIDVKNLELQYPFYNHRDKVGDICQPLFRTALISYFTYEKYYYDGSCLFLPYCPELDYQILQVGHLPKSQELSQNNMHYMILSKDSSVPAYWNTRKKALIKKLNIANQFGIKHIMVLTFNHAQYSEQFFFGVGENIQNYLDFFIIKMSILEKFCVYFRNAASKIISTLHYDRVKYDNPVTIENLHELPNFFATQDLQFGLNDIDLSKRQSECLYYLTKGMSIKQIAKKVNLSPRTVSHYLDAVKIKLNCTRRSDLIEKVFGMNLFNSF